MTKKINKSLFKTVNKLKIMNYALIYLPEVVTKERPVTVCESGVSIEGKAAFRVEPAKFNTTPQPKKATKTTHTHLQTDTHLTQNYHACNGRGLKKCKGVSQDSA